MNHFRRSRNRRQGTDPMQQIGCPLRPISEPNLFGPSRIPDQAHPARHWNLKRPSIDRRLPRTRENWNVPSSPEMPENVMPLYPAFTTFSMALLSESQSVIDSGSTPALLRTSGFVIQAQCVSAVRNPILYAVDDAGTFDILVET